MSSNFEVALRILGSSWGVGSLIALVVGILLALAAKAVRRAKAGSLAGEAGWEFLRFAMFGAFVLAAAGLAIGTVREFQDAAREAKQERIRVLVLELKNSDQTRRRQAVDLLVTHGEDAARELVRAISEEAGVAAAASIGEATDGFFAYLFAMVMGSRPWDRPFFNEAVYALGEIGEPAVPAVFDQLRVESERFEALTRDFEVMAQEADARQQPQDLGDLIPMIQDLGMLLGGAGEALRMAIVREVLVNALVRIGRPAVPTLLEGSRSPQMFIRLTSYEALGRLGALP